MRHALIFAAGLGERMRPLTDRMPKPLLRVSGKPLIEWHLEKLAAAGVHYVVINTSHLAEQFPEVLGDGARWGLRIRYAYEGPTPLETGGGMLNALPLLGSEPFIAVSADIVSDFDYARLPLEPAALAHLVMVPNPDWHARGDFILDRGLLRDEDKPPDGLQEPATAELVSGERLTFGNIGVYRPAFVRDEAPGRFKLLPLYQRAMRAGQLSGERYDGFWRNLGNPQQLLELDRELAAKS